MKRHFKLTTPLILVSAAVLAACQPVHTRGTYDNGVYSDRVYDQNRVYRSSDGQVFRTRSARDAHERWLVQQERSIYDRELAEARERARRRGIRQRNRIEAEARREAEERARKRARRRAEWEAQQRAEAEADARRQRQADRRARREAQEAEEERRRRTERRARRDAELAEQERQRRRAERQARQDAGQADQERERRRAERRARREAERQAELDRQRRIQNRAARRNQLLATTEDDVAYDYYSRFRRPGESFEAFRGRYAAARAKTDVDGGNVRDYLTAQSGRGSK